MYLLIYDGINNMEILIVILIVSTAVIYCVKNFIKKYKNLNNCNCSCSCIVKNTDCHAPNNNVLIQNVNKYKR